MATELPAVILAIGGSDPSGGAGIQADARAIQACGGWPVTAVTAVTVQNSAAYLEAQLVAPALVAAQIRALAEDLPVAAVKTGMLAAASIAGAVADEIERLAPACPLVVDPVMAASAGGALLDAAGVSILKTRLLARAALCTPNWPEAERLAGVPVADLDDARRAAERLLGLGARAVLVTGGHGTGSEVVDLLLDGDGTVVFSSPRVPGDSPRGTGCTLAAAIACGLGAGRPLREAVALARDLVAESIRGALRLGRGAPLMPQMPPVRSRDAK